ncbi:arf-GAP domain and FG repeat-containing protein 1 isoform X2 [Formica exsecta]|uniref:arf-GAP domain and FG repeat-containing protein 1 isoform X1 n=2 Tax=Formica exsecta TaxID=72781 RepID=UPI0011423265|nr:arf-GAP domain and FG repeat-containing protein 1 isoform X1 [Formica exsecta]XP_029659316.1 arf-GAP domain and FG repeat-containing protein 1 isoform X2 [Formica exsecta]
MASAKRKQDERNLKTLREFVSQPGNKQCFDCNQRGPTYVNMTIGSFVCTSCSGMLRGLTPPHRVKSISMATFSQEEIDFIKEHGNDYCRRVWLGLMNMNPPQNLDTKDEQKMKDLMSAKYELKRYYLDPSIANQNNTAQQKSSSSNSSGIPRVPNSGTLPAPVSQKSIDNAESRNNLNNSNNFSTDFVADFSKVPSDPFCPATTNHFGQQPIAPQPTFFANFDNNPIFNNSNSVETSAMFNQVGSTVNGAHAPPSEDRYAALKDLDSLMKQTQLKEETAGMQSTWNANNTNASNATWSIGVGNNHHVVSNPFAGGDLWRPSANVINNNNTQSVDNSLCNSANPFKPTPFSVNNDSQWISIGTPSNGDVLQLSQLVTPLANKVWQPTVPAYHANPFMVGTGVSNMTRNSNNPFL